MRGGESSFKIEIVKMIMRTLNRVNEAFLFGLSLVEEKKLILIFLGTTWVIFICLSHGYDKGDAET